MDSSEVVRLWRRCPESRGWDTPVAVFQSVQKKSWYMLLCHDDEVAGVVDTYTESILDAQEVSLDAIQKMKWRKLPQRAAA